MSPATIVLGVGTPDYNAMRIEFGAFAQVFEDVDPTNTPRARSMGAIALNPTGNSHGSYHFLSLATGSRISRHRWVAQPIPDTAIARVEVLALADGQPLIQSSGIVVEHRPDYPIDAPSMIFTTSLLPTTPPTTVSTPTTTPPSMPTNSLPSPTLFMLPPALPRQVQGAVITGDGYEFEYEDDAGAVDEYENKDDDRATDAYEDAGAADEYEADGDATDASKDNTVAADEYVDDDAAHTGFEDDDIFDLGAPASEAEDDAAEATNNTFDQ